MVSVWSLCVVTTWSCVVVSVCVATVWSLCGHCVVSEWSGQSVCGHCVVTLVWCIDMRPGHCYMRLDGSARDRCDQSLASNLTRRQCCCSIGLGWNAIEDEIPGRPSCQPCPPTGSGTFSILLHSAHF